MPAEAPPGPFGKEISCQEIELVSEGVEGSRECLQRAKVPGQQQARWPVERKAGVQSIWPGGRAPAAVGRVGHKEDVSAVVLKVDSFVMTASLLGQSHLVAKVQAEATPGTGVAGLKADPGRVLG